jgi:hypothetical protein
LASCTFAHASLTAISGPVVSISTLDAFIPLGDVV